MAEQETKAKAETPFKADEIIKLPAPKLIAILNDGEATTFAKAKACQRLAVVGDQSAVPALAALLTDPKLSHYARFGLEPIPGAEAGAALRGALGKVQGNLLIGVINSIGRRKDPKAFEALAELSGDKNADVASAAREALRRLRAP